MRLAKKVLSIPIKKKDNKADIAKGQQNEKAFTVIVLLIINLKFIVFREYIPNKDATINNDDNLPIAPYLKK